MITEWMYDIEADKLEPLLTAEEFEQMTSNKYGGDGRIAPMIEAASRAIRDYCGWHVAPSLDCEFVADSTYISKIIQLPATIVSSVKSVSIDGEELDKSEYFLKRNGMIYLATPLYMNGYNDIVVKYTAGISEHQAAAVKELVMHRVTHALAQSYGIQSETAGGVSVTYSSTWINNARATALADDNKEVLEPYRIKGVY